eukprot:185132-Hanusia_phi.AAC.1
MRRLALEKVFAGTQMVLIGLPRLIEHASSPVSIQTLLLSRMSRVPGSLSERRRGMYRRPSEPGKDWTLGNETSTLVPSCTSLPQVTTNTRSSRSIAALPQKS